MLNKVQDALLKEQEIGNLIEEIKNEMIREIKNTAPLEGAKLISDKYALVSFNTISQNKYNLCPSTYLQSAQAEAVASFISSAKTMSDLLRKIEEMVSTKKAQSSLCGAVTLNTYTLEVIEKYKIEKE